jgi:hypothetical protein
MRLSSICLNSGRMKSPGNAEDFLRAVVLEGAQQRKAEGHGVSPGGLQSPDDRGGKGVAALILIKRRTQTNSQIAQLFMPLNANYAQFVCVICSLSAQIDVRRPNALWAWRAADPATARPRNPEGML